MLDDATTTPEAPKIAPESVTHDAIIGAISTVYDPEIPVNIFELGLIYDMAIESNQDVTIFMTLTSPACPSAQELPEEVRAAVADIPGVREVFVHIVWLPPWDPSLMSDEAKLAMNMF